MDAWNIIINSSTEELYAESVTHFMRSCEKYLYLLKYGESNILDQVKENIVSAWSDQDKQFENTINNELNILIIH